MVETENFGLQHVAVAASGREETINEGFVAIDALLARAVEDFTLTVPPVSPASGLWAVPVGATGAWAGQGGKLALYMGGGWVFLAPKVGVSFVNLAAGGSVVSSGVGWAIGGAVGEAPTDGTAYARKDGAWAEVSLAGGMYDMEVQHAGTATASQVIFSRLLGRNAEFAANFSGSVGKIGVNPTAAFDLDVQADGTTIGTISISTAGAFIFSTVGGVLKAVLARAEIKVIAPATVDATAADIDVQIIANSDGGVGVEVVSIPLVNPDFASGDAAGWNVTGDSGVDVINTAGQWGIPTHPEGLYYLTVPSGTMEPISFDQSFSLPLGASSMTVEFDFVEGFPEDDPSYCELTFLDSGGSLIATVTSAAQHTLEDTWTTKTPFTAEAIPAGTVSVKVRIYGALGGGAQTTHGFTKVRINCWVDL